MTDSESVLAILFSRTTLLIKSSQVYYSSTWTTLQATPKEKNLLSSLMMKKRVKECYLNAEIKGMP